MALGVALSFQAIHDSGSCGGGYVQLPGDFGRAEWAALKVLERFQFRRRKVHSGCQDLSDFTPQTHDATKQSQRLGLPPLGWASQIRSARHMLHLLSDQVR